MATREFARKVWWQRGLVICLFTLLFGRLWSLQVAHGETYLQASQRNTIKRVRIPAPRGPVVDRAGRLLAGGKVVYQACILPGGVPPSYRPSLALEVSRILDVPYQQVLGRLEGKDVPPSSPAILKSDLTMDEVQRVEEHAPVLRGVFVRPVVVRTYKFGADAAHVVGYVRPVTSEELGPGSPYEPGQTVGKQGVEKSYDDSLRGRDGEEEIEINASGQINWRGLYQYYADLASGRNGKPSESGQALLSPTIDPQLLSHLGAPGSEAGRQLAQRPSWREPEPGAKVVLSLDMRLQQAAREAMRGRPGAVIALDPNNGEVLALYSAPAFEPGALAEQFASLQKDPLHPFLNRAIGGTYPPGSVFKLVTLFAALESGKVTADTRIDCSGSLKIGDDPRRFNCWLKQGHGSVALFQAVAESCDVYFWTVALRLGQVNLSKYAELLGCTSKTGIDLGGEVTSVMHGPEWKRKAYWKQGPRQWQWFAGDTANLAIGQGLVTLTPMRVAVITAGIANGGKMVVPRVVKAVIGPGGNSIPLSFPEPQQIPAKKADTWKLIRAGMRQAVSSGRGTAPGAALPGIAVAGKTGSAQTRRGEEPHAWFTCFAPYDHPRIVVTALVENGGMGGDVAVPVAVAVLKAFFSK